jgi:hypothetical protein
MADKDFYRDGYTETVSCSGDFFIIQKAPDGGVNGRKHRPKGVWVADWAGCDGICAVGINGLTRDDVIERMAEIIRRKKELYEITTSVRRIKRCSVLGVSKST